MAVAFIGFTKRGALTWEGPLPGASFSGVRPGAEVPPSLKRRLLRQTADFSPAICSIVRPLIAEIASRFFAIGLAGPPVLLTNHFGLSSSDSVRLRVHSPLSFLPERNTVSAPCQ